MSRRRTSRPSRDRLPPPKRRRDGDDDDAASAPRGTPLRDREDVPASSVPSTIIDPETGEELQLDPETGEVLTGDLPWSATGETAEPAPAASATPPPTTAILRAFVADVVRSVGGEAIDEPDDVLLIRFPAPAPDATAPDAASGAIGATTTGSPDAGGAAIGASASDDVGPSAAIGASASGDVGPSAAIGATTTRDPGWIGASAAIGASGAIEASSGGTQSSAGATSGRASAGGASGASTSGASTSSAGGASTGGASTGGASTGGASGASTSSVGGASTGGASAGGASGASTSGVGGASTGGASAGGASGSGASTGGASAGGASGASTSSAGGASTSSAGGASTGGASTGGASAGGASTSGASTSGASTSGASAGGASTSGAGASGAGASGAGASARATRGSAGAVREKAATKKRGKADPADGEAVLDDEALGLSEEGDDPEPLAPAAAVPAALISDDVDEDETTASRAPAPAPAAPAAAAAAPPPEPAASSAADELARRLGARELRLVFELAKLQPGADLVAPGGHVLRVFEEFLGRRGRRTYVERPGTHRLARRALDDLVAPAPGRKLALEGRDAAAGYDVHVVYRVRYRSIDSKDAVETVRVRMRPFGEPLVDLAGAPETVAEWPMRPRKDAPQAELARALSLADEAVVRRARSEGARLETDARRKRVRDLSRLHAYFSGQIADLERSRRTELAVRRIEELEEERALRVQELAASAEVAVEVEPLQLLLVEVPLQRGRVLVRGGPGDDAKDAEDADDEPTTSRGAKATGAKRSRSDAGDGALEAAGAKVAKGKSGAKGSKTADAKGAAAKGAAAKGADAKGARSTGTKGARGKSDGEVDDDRDDPEREDATGADATGTDGAKAAGDESSSGGPDAHLPGVPFVFDRTTGQLSLAPCPACASTLVGGTLDACGGGHAVHLTCVGTCGRCQAATCAACGQRRCGGCELELCPSCGRDCDSCGAASCVDHLAACHICARAGCGTCLRDCASCGKASCADDRVAAAEDSPAVLCSTCAVACPGCKQPTAPAALARCETCGRRFCAACLPQGASGPCVRCAPPPAAAPAATAPAAD